VLNVTEKKAFAFECACGERHVGSPNYAFSAPNAFMEQPDEVKKAAAFSRDFCAFQSLQGPRYYFARALLALPIQRCDDPFQWGIWVQLEHADYQQYLDAYGNTDSEFEFTAWLRNDLPFYPPTDGLKVRLVSRLGGKLPVVQMERMGDPLSTDLHDGMAQELAARIAATFCLAGGAKPVVRSPS
jgi:hypothetical protein